jgi:hypothetical protein
LYSQFKLDEPWDSDHNKKLLPHMPKVFRSTVAGAEPVTETYFQGFTGKGAAFQAGLKLDVAEFPDGTSNTLLAAEAGPPVPWTRPVDRPYDPKQPLPPMEGPYGDRIVALFVDGSVQDLAWNLPEKTYRALIERADGGIIPHDDIYAPPAGVVTEADKKEVEKLRKAIASSAKYLAQKQVERRELIADLERTGGVPEATLTGPNAGVEEWRAALERLGHQESLIYDEVKRLRLERTRREKAK